MGKVNSRGFKYLVKFPKVSAAKLNEGIFIGSQIREIIKDATFEECLAELELKTSIATRYTQDNFWKEYKKTMGVDFYLKRIILRGQVNVVLQIWDVSGLCLGSSMLENYIYGAQGILLVYDITNYISFENLEDWLLIINRASLHSGKSPSHLALVGNKVDLEHVRAVSEERHVKFATDHDMSNHFISAKTGEYVSVCFQRIAAELLGFKLTTAEKEQQQQVVTANIESESYPKVTSLQKSPRSPICSLQ